MDSISPLISGETNKPTKAKPAGGSIVSGPIQQAEETKKLGGACFTTIIAQKEALSIALWSYQPTIHVSNNPQLHRCTQTPAHGAPLTASQGC